MAKRYCQLRKATCQGLWTILGEDAGKEYSAVTPESLTCVSQILGTQQFLRCHRDRKALWPVLGGGKGGVCCICTARPLKGHVLPSMSPGSKFRARAPQSQSLQLAPCTFSIFWRHPAILMSLCRDRTLDRWLSSTCSWRERERERESTRDLVFTIHLLSTTRVTEQCWAKLKPVSRDSIRSST